MKKIWLGSIDRTNLLIRFFSPLWGIKSIIKRSEYEFSFRTHPKSNFRCYCFMGYCFEGRIRIAGYGFVVWFSLYNGEIPCNCDRQLDELFGRE